MSNKRAMPVMMMQSEQTDYVQLAPRHALKRVADYYNMGGFQGKQLPPLVLNALSDLAEYYSPKSGRPYE